MTLVTFVFLLQSALHLSLAMQQLQPACGCKDDHLPEVADSSPESGFEDRGVTEGTAIFKLFFKDNFFLNFLQLYCPNGISPMGKFGLLSPRKASCNSHDTQPLVHAGYFSVSTIYQTLTWTTGSLMCAQMFMHVIGRCKRVCTES